MPLITPYKISIEGEIVKSEARTCKSSANSLEISGIEAGCQISKLSRADEYEDAIQSLDLLMKEYVKLVNKDMDNIISACEEFERTDEDLKATFERRIYV